MASFAKLFIVNPDLPARIANNWPVETTQNLATWFGGGATGYTTPATYSPK